MKVKVVVKYQPLCFSKLVKHSNGNLIHPRLARDAVTAILKGDIEDKAVLFEPFVKFSVVLRQPPAYRWKLVECARFPSTWSPQLQNYVSKAS